jgi:hypothetical protein
MGTKIKLPDAFIEKMEYDSLIEDMKKDRIISIEKARHLYTKQRECRIRCIHITKKRK